MIDIIPKIDKSTVPFISRNEMIEIDRIAIEETGPNLWQMMENAGRNLAELIFYLSENNLNNKVIIILAGKGNNAGGGIRAARHLMNHGADVKLIIADEANLSDVPNYQYLIYKNSGGKLITLNEAENLNPDFIIDSLIGYNLKGSPKNNFIDLINFANSKKTKIISLDIPSGINSDNGNSQGVFIKPFATLTLALPKTGLTIENSGRLFLGDIGIPKMTFEKIGLKFEPLFSKSYLIELI